MNLRDMFQKGVLYLTALTTLASFTGCSEGFVKTGKPFEVKGRVVFKKFKNSQIKYLVNVNQDSMGRDTTYLFRTFDDEESLGDRATRFNNLIHEGDIVTLKSYGYTKSPKDSVFRTRYARMWK